MRALAAALVLSSGAAWAEAGIRWEICRDATCACAGVSCSCGQVCDANTPRCLGSSQALCSGDGDCDAGCDVFVCRMGSCVRPDGGTVAAGPGPSGAGGGTGAGGGAPRGCGCGSAPGVMFLLALISAARTCTATSASRTRERRRASPE